MDIRDYMKNSIAFDRKLLSHYKKLADTQVHGRLNCRYDKRRKKIAYYIKGPADDREHYVKRANLNHVWKLQQKRLGCEMVRILKYNINLKKRFCERLRSDNVNTVINTLPKAYQPNAELLPRRRKQQIKQSENPYKRDGLIELTSFGLYVRSKGELAIAELLYALGIEFYYERALELNIPIKSNGRTVWMAKTYYPDFTIVLPDGEYIYWEHKGMLNSKQYVERDIEKEVHYNLCGIYQPHNLIVTSEGPNNDMDMEAIKRIISGIIMPLQ